MEEKIDTNDSFFKKILLPEFRDALPTPKSKNSTKTESNSKKNLMLDTNQHKTHKKFKSSWAVGRKVNHTHKYIPL